MGKVSIPEIHQRLMTGVCQRKATVIPDPCLMLGGGGGEEEGTCISRIWGDYQEMVFWGVYTHSKTLLKRQMLILNDQGSTVVSAIF